MNLKMFKKLLKRQHPYSPAAYLGRKNVEQILGADIVKRKKLEKLVNNDRKRSD